MAAKSRLARTPPVRRNAADRALPRRIDPEDELRIGRQGTISPELQIEQVVEETVGAQTGNLLRVYLLDERAGGRHRRQLLTYVRKAPGGGRGLDVLDR